MKSDDSAATDFEARVGEMRAAVEHALADLTPGAASPRRLADAMRHSLLAPAKRVRAVLALLGCVECGGNWRSGVNAACAVEMVHAASLIIDDLPQMDDAGLRRGQPACHRVYGDATATLAAIALLNRAFAVVAADEVLPPARRVAIAEVLAASIGTDGLAGGQEADLNGTALAGVEAVDWIHRRKTAVLIAAAAETGAIVAGADHRRAELAAFGIGIGMAFQGYDDLLDACASTVSIGKDAGRDGDKATLVKLLGEEAALRRADEQMAAARAGLGTDGDLAQFVATLAQQMRAPLRARLC